ncbi:2-Hydroxyacid oxidase 1-like [Lytechinus pictus]|uniref:2-Hydroxyacid oxidase 1-like n=1 Tax=Lytechinus pictus TaxID=7653 RepID=UPI0030B9BBA1
MELRTLPQYEAMARRKLSEPFFRYYSLSSGEGLTKQDSEDAFKSYRFRPRLLEDVSCIRLSTEVLGQSISMPICISPTGAHRLANIDAEKATAQGALEAETLMIQSCFSHERFSQVARAAPGGLRWCQVYIFKDRPVTLHLIREAERAGYRAVVLTMDSPLTGFKASEVGRDYMSFRHDDYRYVNMEMDSSKSQAASKRAGDPTLFAHFGLDMDSTVTWDDVRWLKTVTSLPIVCKGILTGEAARKAANVGADAILVSAHGGRQLDGVPAPIDALAEVVDAVRGCKIEVYMDGGVRRGTDVLKALARGAKAVFIGRPVLWGLACEGASGVSNVLKILRQELRYAMGLCGCSDVNDIPEDVVVHESFYHQPRPKL